MTEKNQYEVIAGGTQNKAELLVCLEGFSYTKRNCGKKYTRWLCSSRTTKQCNGTVLENNGNFTRTKSHTHPGDPKNVHRLQTYREVGLAFFLLLSNKILYS